MLGNFLAVICLSMGLDLKISGTELTITNQMDLVTTVEKMVLNVPVFRGASAFKEAKEVERSPYTTVAATKTLSCSSKWSSSSISSESTEQRRI